MLQRGDQVDRVDARSASGPAESSAHDVDAQAWADPKHGPPPSGALEQADAVLHLLGEPIAQRWSDDAKREIRDSRVLSTRSLVAAIAALPEDVVRACWCRSRPPATTGPAATSRSTSRPPRAATSSPASTAMGARSRPAASAGVRVATTRTGVVLSPQGGALEKMLPPFKLGVGGPVAGGRQYVPWIHLDDVVGAMLRCLDDDAARARST